MLRPTIYCDYLGVIHEEVALASKISEMTRRSR